MATNETMRDKLGAGSRGPIPLGALIDPAHMKSPPATNHGETPKLYKNK